MAVLRVLRRMDKKGKGQKPMQPRHFLPAPPPEMKTHDPWSR